MTRLVVATRGSKLALAQTHWVIGRLQALHPEVALAVSVLKTQGDQSQASGVPLHEVGGKGLFTKELEDALLEGRADLAVHSLKDLPTELPPGLALGCVPEREEPLDAVVTADGRPLEELPAGALVGTSSLRRIAQLSHYRPDLSYVPVRGNVDTRLRKLAEGQVAGLIMAAAGLRRAGFGDRITQLLPPEVCLPAAGQGALGLEIRTGDPAAGALLAGLQHPPTAIAVNAERSFLGRITGEGDPPAGRTPSAGAPGAAPPLGASCQVPVGAFAVVHRGHIHLRGLVASTDGREVIAWEGEGPEHAPQALGRAVAEVVLERGGRALLDRVRSE